MLTANVSVVEVELARPCDALALQDLRDAAARWMQQQGLAQWRPGEIPLESFDKQVTAGEWHVARTGDGAIRAGLRLLWSDAATWGRAGPFAGYVHGLVVSRESVGQGLGAQLLQWAGRTALAADRYLLRLDCVESNLRLRRYYLDQGFREVGRRDLDSGHGHSVSLFERELPGAPDS